MMRRTARVFGVLGVMGAGVLLTGGTASAAPAPRPPAACTATVVSRDIPPTWLPRSSREGGKRLKWEQVSRWDTDRDGRLSDREVRAFQNARVQVPGGPNCGVPVPPPAPPQAVRPRR